MVSQHLLQIIAREVEQRIADQELEIERLQNEVAAAGGGGGRKKGPDTTAQHGWAHSLDIEIFGKEADALAEEAHRAEKATLLLEAQELQKARELQKANAHVQALQTQIAALEATVIMHV